MTIPWKEYAIMALLLVGPSARMASAHGLGPDDRALLATYARDTWRSIEAVSAVGELPADALRRDGDDWVATGLTSPSNIAAYLWSVVAAEDLGLITRDEAIRRLAPTLAAVGRLERSHGFFYNWYDPRTGERARTWPGGGHVRPFLSSVDNGWLAAALILVGNARPELREAAGAILGPMDFGFFYDPFDPAAPTEHPGLLRGGFWPETGTFTEFHYGTLNTEPRIASYVGIARGHLPGDHYYRMSRARPANPGAPGPKDYRGLKIVPSWDGTMFEALMVPLLVPEAEWAPQSWGVNHPLYVRAQIEYGLQDARVGFWGISAAMDPAGGYQPFGVSEISAWAQGQPPAPARGAVVTPHASFLALRFAPLEAMANLRGLAARFPVYSPYGFLDSVDVATGRVADRVLVLDQGMILAAIANALADDGLRRAFSAGAIETAIRPLMAAEQFDAGINQAARPAAGPPEVIASAAAPVPAPSRPALRTEDGASRPVPPPPHVWAVPAPAASGGEGLGVAAQAAADRRTRQPQKRRRRPRRRGVDGQPTGESPGSPPQPIV